MDSNNETLFQENDIVNIEFYEGVKYMITCSICLDIIKDPIQCDKCQHCFCSNCAKQLKNCPFRCQNNKFVPSIICKNLLAKLIIRCKCGKEIGYDFIKKHKNEECSCIDFKEKYIELKKKYDKEIKEMNDFNFNKNDNAIKSFLHHHPIVCVRVFLKTWTCDNCKKCYNDETPSYRCTLCDFDLCYSCAKNTITKGKIFKEMDKYYKNESYVLTDYSTISSLHRHPLEYIKRFLPNWYCDSCKKLFTNDTPTFRCTLCDFDLCYNCAEKTNITQNLNNQRNSNNNNQRNRLDNTREGLQIEDNFEGTSLYHLW